MGSKGERLQSQMLAIMQARTGPTSAYDLLGALQETNAKIAPTTVYRALASLTKQGRIHRLESLNAYVPCQCSDHEQASILSICDECGTVRESIAPKIMSDLSSILIETGFHAQRHVIEVHGHCSGCNEQATA